MDTNDPFSNIDWGPLLQRLVAFARNLFEKEGCHDATAVLPATGQSAEDLVYDAVLDFIVRHPTWQPSDPSQAPKELYLRIRMAAKNDFLDLVRDGRAYKRTEIVGVRAAAHGDGPMGGGDGADGADDPTAAIIEGLDGAQVAAKAFDLVRGDPPLVDYLDAVLVQGYTKRTDIAEYLGVPPDEVTRRRGRLKTRLAPLMRACEARRSSINRRA